jgi:hypothetical protein
MKRGTLVAAAVVFIVTVSTTVRGAVVLQSAEMADGAGHSYHGVIGNSYQPTTYSPAVPFPNDAQNYATVGPDGLRIAAYKVAGFSHTRGNSTVEEWAADKFNVRFDLDEPAAYTYTRRYAGLDDIGVITLQAEGQPPVELPPYVIVDKSGVLPAGHYTFSGVVDFGSYSPWRGAEELVVRRNGGYNVLLTVAPEPTALPVLGLMFVTLRRRTRR